MVENIPSSSSDATPLPPVLPLVPTPISSWLPQYEHELLPGTLGRDVPLGIYFHFRAVSEKLREEFSNINRARQNETLESEQTEEVLETGKRKKPSKRGRKTKPDTLILDKFESTRSPFARPKKEYLRIRVIRGYKRAIRQVHDKSTPRTKIHRVPEDDESALEKWTSFRVFVKKYESQLLAVSLTTEGPNTEGVALRGDGEWTSHKCHTDLYCREFFKEPIVREGFMSYLDIVFSSESNECLASRFGFQAKGENDEEKTAAWEALKRFLYVDMFEDLDAKKKLKVIKLPHTTLRPRAARH